MEVLLAVRSSHVSCSETEVSQVWTTNNQFGRLAFSEIGRLLNASIVDVMSGCF